MLLPILRLLILKPYPAGRHIIHLMSDPEGKSFVLPRIRPDVSRDEVKGILRTGGKTKLTGFPRDLTLSVLLYF